jgi:hypothetical protein
MTLTDMTPNNVDAGILANINDSGLQGLIENTGYQNVSSSQQLPEGVNLSFAGEQTPVGVIPGQPGNTGQPGMVQQQPALTQPVTAPRIVETRPDPRQAAEVQRLQQVAFEAAQARIDAEERAFAAEIRDLPDHEQQLAITERELNQTKQVNQWLNQKRQQERQAQMTQAQQLEAQQQDAAKRQWGFIYATQAGLPFNNEAIRSAILAARDQAHMQTIVRDLAGIVSGSRGQQAQQQLQGGVFAAGGNNGAAATGPRPVPRSGDLDTLIQSRNYQTVNWG